MLCSRCQDIFLQDFDATHYNCKHSECIGILRESSRNGCQICTIICLHIDSRPENASMNIFDLSYNVTIEHDEVVINGSFYRLEFVYDREDESAWEYVPTMGYIPDWKRSKQLFVLKEDEKIGPAFANAKDILSTNTSSADSLEQAQLWMHECILNHRTCNEPLSEAKWWPNRLIDVGDSSDDTSVRLTTTADSQPSGPYLTLSHCWGEAQFLKLSTYNISELQAAIRIDLLPKTFREAISVARAFKVHYLWIDSLCIIQDSVEDWNREASLMSNVYRHAICNIAATGANDSNGGLFVERDPQTLHPCKVQLPCRSRSTSFPSYVMDPQYWKIRVDTAPLIRRAWVVQERLLAKRVLHFGKDQLLWECKEKVACEVFPKGMPRLPREENDYDFKAIVPQTFNSFTRMPMNGNNKRSQDTASIWNTILACYSRGQLTRAGDKEAAMSGIANALEKIFDDSYIVGFWKKGIPFQLLWRARSPSRRSTTYRGPSWLWFSMDGEIDSYLPPLLPSHIGYSNPCTRVASVQIEDMAIIRDGPSPLSPITGGHIQVRGRLKAGTWSKNEELIFKFDGVSTRSLNVPLAEPFRGFHDDTIRTTFGPEDIWCLLVEEIHEIADFLGHGLVLKRASRQEGKMTCYERVGKFLAYGIKNRKIFGIEQIPLEPQREGPDQEPSTSSEGAKQSLSRDAVTVKQKEQTGIERCEIVNNLLTRRWGSSEESIFIL